MLTVIIPIESSVVKKNFLLRRSSLAPKGKIAKSSWKLFRKFGLIFASVLRSTEICPCTAHNDCIGRSAICSKFIGMFEEEDTYELLASNQDVAGGAGGN